MTHIIDFLNGEHRRVEKLLLVLEEELAVFDCQERPDYEVLQTLVRFFEDYAGSRHEATERILFDVLRECDVEAAAMLDGLESEHRDDSKRLQRLAWVLTNILGDRDVPRRALDEVARDFIEHARHQIDFEERVLFPAAMKALRPEDWAEIEAQVGAPSSFETEPQQKLCELSTRILQWEQENQMVRA
jgi:hemerythrin-like domain-containing protein